MLAQRDSKLEAALSAGLSGRFGRPVYAFERVGSTMDVAHELAAAGAGEGTLVWAARQEQGRGRLGRAWASPEGGIYFSFILRPVRPAAEAPQLSLVAGLAAAEATRELTGLAPSVRWPNDLLMDGKKVAGILAEGSKLEAGGRSLSLAPRALSLQLVVVIGIGINVTTDPAHLPETATSLVAAMTSSPPGPTLARAGAGEPRAPNSELAFRLTATLCRHFDRWYDVWTARGFGPIREALRPRMALFGQPVHITAGSEHLEGTAADLDESGRLLVRLDSGLLRAFEVGEVTLLR